MANLLGTAAGGYGWRVSKGRFVRRAMLRGSLAAGLASMATAVPGRRRWPGVAGPSAAAGLASGAVLEQPVVGAVLAVAGAAAVRARIAGLSPPTLATGVVAGGAAALVTRQVWPLAPRTPAEIRSTHTSLDVEPGKDGHGLTIVVNQSAGSSERCADVLRDRLAEAEVLEVGDGLDLATAIEKAVADARVLGIAGGDGSINAAAAVAHKADKPLFVVPAGTLNHLARDLGLTDADDAVTAFRQGHTVAVDLGTIDGRPFLNTASVGGYTDLVDARERLQGRIGKWPALLVALAGFSRRGTPVRVELDGKERSLWMIFVGNCGYRPAGFAPTWRERLDDGVLDVRLVDAASPWGRLRLLLAVVTGRLGRCRVYEAFNTSELRVKALDGPLRLARDGETFDGSSEFSVKKEERPLAIYVPRSEHSPA